MCIVVLVSSVNDLQKQKQFAKLNEKKNDRLMKVLRDGQQHQISVFDVRVGDIVLIDTGDIVSLFMRAVVLLLYGGYVWLFMAVGWLVGWLVGWVVGWLVGLLVGWLVGYLLETVRCCCLSVLSLTQ